MNARKAISFDTTLSAALLLAILILAPGLSMRMEGAATSYAYDALNRLTHVTYADGSFIAYTYDPAGNRLVQSTTGAAAVITNAATNVASFSATLNGSVNPNGATTTVYF